MALVGSGWISIGDISQEFGVYDNGTRWLSWYYRGARVPNIGRNASVPTSGAIWLSQFYNTSASVPGSYFPRGIGWSNFTWPAYENMDVYVYGGGGGGGGANYAIATLETRYQGSQGDRSYTAVIWEQFAGLSGGGGGDSIFQCNGFNITATGGGGGYGNYYNGEYFFNKPFTVTTYFNVRPPQSGHGYGVNGDVNQSGGGGGGGGGAYFYTNPLASNDFGSFGGNGGNGGFAKRSFTRNGYGSYPTGSVTSLHIGGGGGGGATGGGGRMNQQAWWQSYRYSGINGGNWGSGGSGGQGWIDIYWS